MPRIKRWFPVAHDFNRDPQIIQLRLDFGDWAALAWQELLSIADRNDGIVPGSIDQIAHILAPITLQKYHERAANACKTLLRRFTDNSWITVEHDCIRIVKYAEYHRTREHQKFPSGPDRTRPELIKNKNKINTVSSEPEKTSGSEVKAPTPFPDKFKWLEEFVAKQNGGFPKERFLDFQWWDVVSYTCGGLSLDFLTREFASMKRWLMDNPARAPTPRGYRRFVASWLERAHERERRFKDAGTRK